MYAQNILLVASLLSTAWAQSTAVVTITASHGGAGNGLTNTTISVPLNSTYTNVALDEVSYLYLTGANGVPLESITCTPYRYANGTGNAGLPFTSSKPSLLSTNTVQVGSLICTAIVSTAPGGGSISSSISTTTSRSIPLSSSSTSPSSVSSSTTTTSASTAPSLTGSSVSTTPTSTLPYVAPIVSIPPHHAHRSFSQLWASHQARWTRIRNADQMLGIAGKQQLCYYTSDNQHCLSFSNHIKNVFHSGNVEYRCQLAVSSKYDCGNGSHSGSTRVHHAHHGHGRWCVRRVTWNDIRHDNHARFRPVWHYVYFTSKRRSGRSLD
ncbi:hypothetical protein BAUCODRAFT_38597 [Baudoinia panamericana UAMH 10762]|uniref:Uncharacterized protein n=1 Tax=Baudoinia panamericana (strain UAMH 10762) TaxID=717646 RepID=M2N0V5_BAUPA|nr:uncharacterized protein BAUCODRAFT_38597 [Baudoinia panamericana UAMH 10762]EMC92529.1 hypothetical protein BAUCODRAFT_38597 [Baudoinia panamericana UAMH 10762]